MLKNFFKFIKTNLGIIFICTVFLCTFSYLFLNYTIPIYRNYLGHFTPITKNNINKNPINIYKSGDRYLIIDNKTKKIYTAKLISKPKSNWYFSILESNIEQKIGDFKGNIQLGNKKVLFYNYKEVDPKNNTKTPLDFIIYDIQTNSANKKISSFVKSAYSLNCIYPVGTNGDFLYSIYNNADNNNIIRYNSDNHTQKIIPNKNDIYICNYIKNNEVCSEKWLIFSKPTSSENCAIKLDQFNHNNNTFQKVESSALCKILNQKKIGNYYKIFPLNDSYFLLFGYSFKTKENIISLFKIHNNSLMEVYTTNPKEDSSFKTLFGLKFGIDTPNIFALNDKELLLTGGINGRADFSIPRNEAYVYNIKTKKLKRIGNMNYQHKWHSALTIDSKRVLIYDEYCQKDGNMEIFERGKLW